MQFGIRKKCSIFNLLSAKYDMSTIFTFLITQSKWVMNIYIYIKMLTEVLTAQLVVQVTPVSYWV